MWKVRVFTLYPEMFPGPLASGLYKKALEKKIWSLEVVNIRDYAMDKHKTVDDPPFGGGSGMVMRADVLANSLDKNIFDNKETVIYLSPKGKKFDQKFAKEISNKNFINLICGHFEGVDERVRNHLATREISIGDYVLGGGEIPAMVVIEAVSRLTVGVLGSIVSTEDDTFTTGLIQHPQYTRPSVYRDWSVPNVLLSGNHLEVEKWRRRESLKKTIL